MPNTYLQKSLERQIFRTGRFAKRHQKNCQPTRFNLALPRAVSKPMKLSDTVISKASLYIGPIAVQRRYFPPDARALNMLFQAAQPVLILKPFQNGSFFKNKFPASDKACGEC